MILCLLILINRPGFEYGIPIHQFEQLNLGKLGGILGCEIKPGDWCCPKCNENVFAKRNRCYRCTTPRPGLIIR